MQSLVAIQKADGAAGARENAAAAKRPPPPPPQEEAKRDDPFSLRPPVARKPGAVKTWRGEDLDAAVAARLRQQVQLQTAASATPHALASPANQPPLDATSRRDSMPSSLATWSPPRRMKPLRRQRRAPPQAPPLLPPLRFPALAPARRRRMQSAQSWASSRRWWPASKQTALRPGGSRLCASGSRLCGARWTETRLQPQRGLLHQHQWRRRRQRRPLPRWVRASQSRRGTPSPRWSRGAARSQRRRRRDRCFTALQRPLALSFCVCISLLALSSDPLTVAPLISALLPPRSAPPTITACWDRRRSSGRLASRS